MHPKPRLMAAILLADTSVPFLFFYFIFLQHKVTSLFCIVYSLALFRELSKKEAQTENEAF